MLCFFDIIDIEHTFTIHHVFKLNLNFKVEIDNRYIICI